MVTQMTVEEISLDVLREHPRQREFFISASEAEVIELAIDLSRRGQQEPIHACPDGTVFRGHRRVAAARFLKWKTIKAVIRHDLADPGSDATIAELITDNLIRQQLDDLALARCYHELKKSGARSGDGSESGDVRDRLAARLKTGKSGRSLDRLERLLQLPRDIQDMISLNQLNKFQGEKILKLPPSKRDALVAELRSQQTVPDVLRRYGVMTASSRKSPLQLGEELLRFFHSHVQTIREEIEQLDCVQVPGVDAVQQLDEAIKVLSTWVKRKRSLRNQSIDSLKQTLKTPRCPDNLST